MPKSGPIVFIEDDPDDQELFAEAIQQLRIANQLKFLSNGEDALAYLRTTADRPFIIFCDINMPEINGIELRNEIMNDKYLKSKGIPFIFLTTSINKETIHEAYCLSIQGYFEKPHSFEEIKATLQEVTSYWQKCKDASYNGC